MVSSLLVATLLAADADLHAGGALGFGVGAPFKTANTGFQLSVKGFVDIGVIDKLTVGAVVPVGFGFYNAGGLFGSNVSFLVVDIMPGVRGRYAVLDWIHAVVELGLGPAVYNTRVDITIFGMTSSMSETRTYFAMRAALLVEIAPPSLSGVMFFVEPVSMHGRFDQAWSEYRFSAGVGYRR